MPETVLLALLSAPLAILLDRSFAWIRNRRKDDAEADLTVGTAWQQLADGLRGDIENLRKRVDALEADLDKERERSKGLTAEVDRYRRIAQSLARHVLRLRDALGKANVEVPLLPSDVEDALTIINLP